jgi:hypothetical protein
MSDEMELTTMGDNRAKVEVEVVVQVSITVAV